MNVSSQKNDSFYCQICNIYVTNQLIIVKITSLSKYLITVKNT